MRNWIRVLLSAALVAGLSLAFTARAADAPKKDDKKPADGKDDKKPAADEKKKDPKDMSTEERETAGLCIVEPAKNSKPVYHADYKDKTYHFCCREHQKEFVADPAKYFKADAPKK